MINSCVYLLCLTVYRWELVSQQCTSLDWRTSSTNMVCSEQRVCVPNVCVCWSTVNCVIREWLFLFTPRCGHWVMGSWAHLRTVLASVRLHGELPLAKIVPYIYHPLTCKINCLYIHPLYPLHMHSLPQVYNGSLETPYTDPKAPIHIVSGSAVSWP